jgi:toxin-antitoxin system PIN domain toxin
LRPYLLDTNVLIALAWPSHVHHQACQTWFARNRVSGFRTCPLTQTSFVRISSNPGFYRRAVSPGEALALLRRITALPEHDFWPADIPAAEALASRPLVSHRQITDAYLLGLARSREGILATLDRAVTALAEEPWRVELIGAELSGH